MKFTAFFSLLTAMLLAGCRSGSYVLDSDYDYHGKFKEYQTFAFLNIYGVPIGKTEEEIIQKTIFKRFTSMGYRYTSSEPDILISYRFFEQPVVIKGFNQNDLNLWLSTNANVDYPEIAEKEKIYHRKKVTLPAESYMVYFLDAKESRVIWQGYSGQLGPWTHELQLIASVSRMLDDYKVTTYDLKEIRN